MITERHEELAALHAFDLLEGAECSSFEAELTGNGELRALCNSLRESAATLALTAPSVPPPPALKDRILAAVAVPAPPAAVVIPGRSWAPWAIAAALTLAATWLATQNLALRNQNATLRSERELAEVAYKIAQSQLTERTLLAEKLISSLGTKLLHAEDLARLKVTALASLAGNTKEAEVIAVWDPEQQGGLLTMDKLPAIADTQDYQIWIVDPAYPNPVNGGIFHLTSNGRAALPFKPDQPVKQAAAFAISLEKKGGVPKAEGPIVLLGK
jgi:anti-sigma-K factor RskA